MKIETPQILWHNGSEGNGKPAPLYSVSILPAVADANDIYNNIDVKLKTNINDDNAVSSSADSVDILATAGNSNEIHIWKIKFSAMHNDNTESTSTVRTGTGDASDNNSHVKSQKNVEPPAKKTKIFSLSSPLIQHITTLTRHERSINAISFSPNGNHLASAGDGGALMVHSVPSIYRYQDANVSFDKSTCLQKFWKTILQKESDLSVKVLHTAAEDVIDISWSPTSDKFIIGTLDHSVIVYKEDYCPMEQVVKSWNCIWKNNKEHTHYVQGVAYDPLGVYIASQGSDRTVRVWQHKYPKTSMANNGKSVNANVNSGDSGVVTGSVNDKEQGELGLDSKNVETNNDKSPAVSSSSCNTPVKLTGTIPTPAAVFDPVGTKFDVEKAKILKYRMSEDGGDDNDTGNEVETQEKNSNSIKKRHLYADESTVESFFRRLSWTTDGSFLMTPAAVWHGNDAGPSFATLLFARHQFEKPYKVFHGLEKPSVAICSNPILFQLPKKESFESTVQNVDNENSTSEKCQRYDSILPYRSIFAVLTIDSIYVYDTYHSAPLCIARNLHYAGLTDCSWSPDGHHLVVSSTDGYISIISFGRGDLGEVYVPIRTNSFANGNGSA
mmetsp:Transcript_8250/g.15537  ORF Transcript_8250/g.15537 Transcript_8250/m.15537 type:complete len:612 (+) Transcript_8250:87-1922(+)